MDLVLIRHGRPLRVEREDGQPANPELTPEGLQQAELVGKWLSTEHFDSIYSSPMRRAMETAEPLAKLLGMSIETCDAVAEFDQLSPSYVPNEELKITDYKRWKELQAGGWNFNMSPEAFQKIVVDALEAIIDENAGKRIAVFCHGGVINMWTAAVIGGVGPRMFFPPEYTGINRYRAKSSKTITVICLNEIAHLRDM